MVLTAPDRLRWLGDCFAEESEHWPDFRHALFTSNDWQALDSLLVEVSGNEHMSTDLIQLVPSRAGDMWGWCRHQFGGQDTVRAFSSFFTLARQIVEFDEVKDRAMRTMLRDDTATWWLEVLYDTIASNYAETTVRVLPLSVPSGIEGRQFSVGLFEASAEAIRLIGLDLQTVEVPDPVLRYEDRDRYCYETRRTNQTWTWKEVARHVTQHGPWGQVGEDAARVAAARYADRNGLAKIRRKS